MYKQPCVLYHWPLPLPGGRIRISETFDDPTSSSRLTIDPLLRSDAGMFECIAANVDGSSSAFVSVDVHCECMHILFNSVLIHLRKAQRFLSSFLFT